MKKSAFNLHVNSWTCSTYITTRSRFYDSALFAYEDKPVRALIVICNKGIITADWNRQVFCRSAGTRFECEVKFERDNQFEKVRLS